MILKSVSELNKVEELDSEDSFLVEHGPETFRTTLEQVKEYIQDDLPERIDDALEEAKNLIAEKLSGRNEWLAPVNTAAQLKTDGLDNEINYLCKVVADPVQSGVYQAVAGWTDEPEWELFDDTVDLVNEEELKAGIAAHNESGTAHEDIREEIKDETAQREANIDAAVNHHNESDEAHNDIREAIENETRQRAENVIDAIDEHNQSGTAHEDIRKAIENEISGHDESPASHEDIRNILDGIHATSLTGAFLTRVINGITPVAKNLFALNTVFISGKTLINDENGTIGVYVNDADSATMNIETKTTAPIAPNEPALLGNVAYFSSLPLTVNDAIELGWNTPRIDDYARVLNDETNEGRTVEWYISSIDGSGNITWANPVIINTSDYQAQTAVEDAGRVLTGGAAAGFFGQSLGIDSEPSENSNNLISSGAVHAFLDVIYPVGSIYMSVENSPPPIGEWTAWGAGRVPVGVDDEPFEFRGKLANTTLLTQEYPTGDINKAIWLIGASQNNYVPYIWSGTAWKTFNNSEYSMFNLSTIYDMFDTLDDLINSRPVGTNMQFAIAGNRLYQWQTSVNEWVYIELEKLNEFGTVQNEGGFRRHTLTINEMPSHNHSYVHKESTSKANGSQTSAGGMVTDATSNAGGSQPHNNMQPYITCYMFKRVQ